MTSPATATADSEAPVSRNAQGAAWAVVSQVTRQAVQLVSFLVLTRMLLPEEFGLLAMATVFTGFAGLVSQLGFEAAVVQANSIGARALTGMFWLGLWVSLAIGALFTLLASPIADFYGEPRLAAVLIVLSGALPLNAVASVPRALLMRQLDFRSIAIVDAVCLPSAFFIAVAAAAAGLGVHSLAAGVFAQAALAAAGLLLRSGWRPESGWRPRDLDALGSYWGFSSNLVGFHVINYWARNADNLLVGKVLGAAALGYYERAYLMLIYPLSQVTAAVSRVVLSSMSRVHDDLAQARRLYLRSVGAISVVVSPLMLGICALSETFVVVVFGSEWRPAIPALAILSAAAPLQAIASTVGLLYQSQGRTALMLRMGVFNAVLIVLAIVGGVWVGSITAVAASYAVMSTCILLYPTVAVPGRLVGMRFREFVQAAAGGLGCALVMALAVTAFDRQLGVLLDAGPRLMVGTFIGAVVYGVLLAGLRIRAAVDLATVLLRVLGRARGSVVGLA